MLTFLQNTYWAYYIWETCFQQSMKYLIQSIFDVVNFEGKEYYTTKTILKKGISQQGQLVSALSSLWIQPTAQQKLIWQMSRYICKCIFWKCVFRKKKKVSTEVGEYTQTWNSIFNDLHGTRPFAWLYALSRYIHIILTVEFTSIIKGKLAGE